MLVYDILFSRFLGPTIFIPCAWARECAKGRLPGGAHSAWDVSMTIDTIYRLLDSSIYTTTVPLDTII